MSKPRGSTAGRGISAYFQYIGKSGLRVIGPLSGRRYCFVRPGAIVAVDYRDQKAFRKVSLLRQVPAPY